MNVSENTVAARMAELGLAGRPPKRRRSLTRQGRRPRTEDLFSRRMLGHAMSEHHDAALVVASLRMAAAIRGGDVDGVVFHTDRGSEGGFNRSSQHSDRGVE
ncbi:transposase family protein [Lentzea tibetensis]|uniref:Transposase family protein n=1 Tax=Lentzea tibetensis TaxID=2591470 RepID=A0A563EEK6_9PSEU|nr:transposase family protein [Lentzea tibetensis]TWP43218.1 transposase family protein [Lentzea tibetensis]